eukprot:365186-Chlamydomonas_euryale.AAC.4
MQHGADNLPCTLAKGQAFLFEHTSQWTTIPWTEHRQALLSKYAGQGDNACLDRAPATPIQTLANASMSCYTKQDRFSNQSLPHVKRLWKGNGKRDCCDPHPLMPPVAWSCAISHRMLFQPRNSLCHPGRVAGMQHVPHGTCKCCAVTTLSLGCTHRGSAVARRSWPTCLLPCMHACACACACACAKRLVAQTALIHTGAHARMRQRDDPMR